MRRMASATLLALAISIVFTVPALAARAWCRVEPTVELDGSVVQMFISVPEEDQAGVNGAVDWTVTVPASVSRSITFVDAGFNGHGEVVTFVDHPGQQVQPSGSFTIHVDVVVPVDGHSVPTFLEILTADGTWHTAHGTSNGTHLSLTVPGQ